MLNLKFFVMIIIFSGIFGCTKTSNKSGENVPISTTDSVDNTGKKNIKNNAPVPEKPAPVSKPVKPDITEVPAKKVEPVPQPFRIVAVGDLMTQTSIERIYTANLDNKINTFGDFENIFKGAPIVYGNLETPVTEFAAGPKFRKKNTHKPLPYFSTTEKVLQSIISCGFNVVSLSNNHVLDQGRQGLIDTLKYLEKNKLDYFGAGQNGRRELLVRKVNGISVGFLGFTSFVNVQQWDWKLDTHWIGRMHDEKPAEIKKAAELVAKYRKEVDLLIVSVHWGRQFDKARIYQKRAAKILAESGADIILGHHPHVVQSAEYIQTKRGSRTFVIYSLGNSFANMGITGMRQYRDGIRAASNDTMVLDLKVSPQKGKTPTVEASWTPAYSMPERNGKKLTFRLVDIRREIKRRKDAATCRDKKFDVCFALEYRMKYMKKILHNLPLIPI
ncbi:CapA family protein [Myxococcota bacterium]|nr:CapA family protein [Myxococcota bacterium]MBU1499236.1 CapA family protein [Myxococcota bacterium]